VEAHILIDDVREARRLSGWTQRTLAARVGVSAQVIKRLEQSVGSVTKVVAVMAALDFRLTGLGLGNTVSAQTRHRRLKQGLSLERLAERTGLSCTTIAQLEKGAGSLVRRRGQIG